MINKVRTEFVQPSDLLLIIRQNEVHRLLHRQHSHDLHEAWPHLNILVTIMTGPRGSLDRDSNIYFSRDCIFKNTGKCERLEHAAWAVHDYDPVRQRSNNDGLPVLRIFSCLRRLATKLAGHLSNSYGCGAMWKPLHARHCTPHACLSDASLIILERLFIA